LPSINGWFRESLEVNHHLKNGGSFWKMINPLLKQWWFGNQAIKNGGWTSRGILKLNKREFGILKESHLSLIKKRQSYSKQVYENII